MAPDTPQERTDLGDLVATRIADLGLSYRRLADLCVDPEAEDESEARPWARGTLENLIKGRRITAPTLPMLRALAVGLSLHLGQVQEAAGAQFLGIDSVWSQDGQARALVLGFREMSPEDQAKVLALIEEKTQLRRD
ncbi:XRE family transcriptional regulator [Streptomyces sp. LBUM 1479]|uniref:XRE family transcriptional regulator n=1 Tax=Streptomyces scabiei TaxID=1930 RepID=UPI001B3072BF|nr:XRE family transcriptional regulator [Streptomyces sp. LBUM 1475]MBP5930212.1 XRE family transcriptional regulator [Streptomyces sp. LBUM 1479]QTU63104.1 XRE family transcriptional regulator [Streptomyces sp. LBUM 1475]